MQHVRSTSAAGTRPWQHRPLAWLLLLILAASWSTDGGSVLSAPTGLPHAELLRKCFQEGQQLQRQQAGSHDAQGATFKAFLSSQDARLNLEAVLWSEKQPCQPGSSRLAATSLTHPDPCPLTVVTTLTLSRISGLEQLCSSWPGPLVAALYVPLELPADSTARVSNATQVARDLQHRMDAAPRGCALRVLVLSEVLQEPVMQMLLPINSLRNAALLAASSRLVTMIDVDLVLSSSLGQQLVPASHSAFDAVAASGGGPGAKPRGAQELVSWCEDGTAVILPALEPHTGRRKGAEQLLQWADRSVRGDKSHLVAMVEAREMCFFQELTYPRGHRLTDFPRWYKAKEPFQIKWQLFYEPWFVVARSRNPWYDVRFQGYGYNKQNHVAGLASSAGVKFWVHPDAWVVHRPHDKTPVHRLYVVALNARAKLLKAGKDVELPSNWTQAAQLSAAQVGALLQHHVNTMFHGNKRDMQAGKYAPHVDAMTRRCVEALPWWNGPGAHSGFALTL